jgi:hypothetical protein
VTSGGTDRRLAAYWGRLQPKEVEMRKLVLGTLAAGLLLVAGGQAAFAKGAPGETDQFLLASPVLGPIPRGLKPGQVWDARIVFVFEGSPAGIEGFRPVVYLHDLSGTDVLPVTGFGVPGTPGTYTARIVFPHAGEWSVVVKSLATGVASTVNAHIAKPDPAGPPATNVPVGHPAPVWSWVAVGLLVLVIVGAGIALAPARRRQRATAG